MNKPFLRESNYQETYKATAHLKAMGGTNYKVFSGKAANGSKIKVIIGQDDMEENGSLTWHMSISCKEQLDDETINQIIVQCWPAEIYYEIERSRYNFELYFIHLYETKIPRQ